MRAARRDSKVKCQSLVKEYVQVICLVRLIFLLTPYSKAGIFCQLSSLRLFLTALNIDLRNLLFVRVVLALPPAIIGVAALLCGATQVSVYDGSWSEWGADTQYPVVKGM